MTIVLRYFTQNGVQTESKYEDDVTRIDLSSRGLVEIDLEPISTCTNLQQLLLHKNELQSIDLRPLAVCTTLRSLNLRDNRIQFVLIVRTSPFPASTITS